MSTVANDTTIYATTTEDAGRKDWADGVTEARAAYWGKTGVVVQRQSGHGSVYELRFSDGHQAWFDKDEIKFA